jgi:hypothetical protein
MIAAGSKRSRLIYAWLIPSGLTFNAKVSPLRFLSRDAVGLTRVSNLM